MLSYIMDNHTHNAFLGGSVREITSEMCESGGIRAVAHEIVYTHCFCARSCIPVKWRDLDAILRCITQV